MLGIPIHNVEKIEVTTVNHHLSTSKTKGFYTNSITITHKDGEQLVIDLFATSAEALVAETVNRGD